MTTSTPKKNTSMSTDLFISSPITNKNTSNMNANCKYWNDYNNKSVIFIIFNVNSNIYFSILSFDFSLPNANPKNNQYVFILIIQFKIYN